MSSNKTQLNHDSLSDSELLVSEAKSDSALLKNQDVATDDFITTDDELDALLESLVVDNEANNIKIEEQDVEHLDEVSISSKSKPKKILLSKPAPLEVKGVERKSLFGMLRSSFNLKDNKKTDKEKIANEKLSKVRIEQAKLAKKAQLKQEQSEKDQLQKEKKEKFDKTKIEKEKHKQNLKKAKQDQEKLQKKLEEQEITNQEKLKQEELEKARLIKAKEAKEKQERARLEREKLKQKLVKARLEQEKLEKERLAKEKAEQEKQKQEQLEKERLAKEKAEQEKQKQVRLEKERLAKEKAEQERLEQVRLEKERLVKEKAEQEKRAQERLEKERLAIEKAEQEKQKQEQLEKERLAKEKAEQERLEQVRLEKERLVKEKAEQERLEQERLSKEKQEQERVELGKAVIKLEREKVELEKAKLELEITKLEQNILAKEKLQKENDKIDQIPVDSTSVSKSSSFGSMLAGKIRSSIKPDSDVSTEEPAILMDANERITTEFNDRPQITAERCMLLCGDNKNISNTGDVEKSAFNPNDFALSLFQEKLEQVKKSHQVIRLTIGDVIIIMDHTLNTVYCNVLITKEEFVDKCCQPIDSDKISIDELDYNEIKAHKIKIREQADFVHSIESFVWTMSLLTSRGRLPENTDVTKMMSLKIGLDLSTLEPIPYASEIVNLLHHEPSSILELSEQLDIPQKFIFAFYNAALSLDKIEFNISTASKAKKSFGKFFRK